jgi:hypothetical protein
LIGTAPAATATSTTTGSFTPKSGRLLVAAAWADSTSGANLNGISISDSLTESWVEITRRHFNSDSLQTAIGVWAKLVNDTNDVSQTVTFSADDVDPIGGWVGEVSHHDVADWLGALGVGTHTSSDGDPVDYQTIATQRDQSLVLGLIANWDATTGSAGSGATFIAESDIATGATSGGVFARRTVPVTPPATVSVPMNRTPVQERGRMAVWEIKGTSSKVPVPGLTTFITYVGPTTSGNVPVPADADTADKVVAIHFLFEDSGAGLPTGVTPPDGTWNLKSSKDQNSGSLRDQIWWKRLTGGDSGTYNFTWTGSCERTATATTISAAVLTGDPFDTTVDHETAVGNGTNTPATEVMPPRDDRLLFWTGSGINGASDWTQPSGFTEHIQQPNITVATKVQYADGATGSLVGSNSSSDEKLAFLGAFRPLNDAAGGGATNVNVGQAVETDTAQPFGRVKLDAIGPAVETDTARPIAPQKQATAGRATETDTAQPFGRVKQRTIGQATTNEIAQAFARRKQRTIGQAVETNLAMSITPQKRRTIGQATSIETATRFVLPARITFGPAVETDTATPFARRKQRTLATATEADTATALARTKQRAVNRATETDTAGVVSRRKEKLVNQVIETDSARTIPPSKNKAIGRATETDTATALTETKIRAVNVATETDTGRPLTRFKSKTYGPAVENDTARPITSAGTKNIPVNRATEIDTAGTIRAQRSRPVGVAVETNTAFAFSRRKERAVGRAIDSQIAQPMGRAKSRTIGRAQETSSAFSFSRRKLVAVGVAVETDSARPILRLGGQEPQPYVRPEGDINDVGGSGDVSRGRPEGILRRDTSTLTYERPSGDITRRK